MIVIQIKRNIFSKLIRWNYKRYLKLYNETRLVVVMKINYKQIFLLLYNIILNNVWLFSYCTYLLTDLNSYNKSSLIY